MLFRHVNFYDYVFGCIPFDGVSRFFSSYRRPNLMAASNVNLIIATLRIHEFLVSKFSTYTGNGITFGAKKAFFLSFDEFLLILW